MPANQASFGLIMTQGRLKVVEFFSGIGGMHYALKATDNSFEICAAFDINQIANTVYAFNFGIKPIATNVEHLPLAYYEKLDADVWLMSPPCQPFTRGGKMLDSADTRSVGLLYLIDTLGKMRNPPKYLFLENVLNFEVSECHRLLVEMLSSLGYRVKEYLLTPCDPWVNIPNTRLRYYLAAERIQVDILPLSHQSGIFRSFSEAFGEEKSLEKTRTIESFLRPPADITPYLVPHKYLTDYIHYRHDIVKPTDTACSTFTKAYGSKYIIGTGSFVQTREFDRAYEKDDPKALIEIGLRFFTPLEIALLHGFPAEDSGECKFGFPATISTIHQYRLLGNSLNVPVVTLILKDLLCPSQPPDKELE